MEGRPSRTEASLKANSPKAAYNVGVFLLTTRDRTRADLSRLLVAKGFAHADAQVALDRLQEEGYLNDRRFATAWARSRLQTKPMGPYRLGKELETKGVEEQLVGEVLGDLYEEGEEPVARRAMAGKLSALRRLPASARTIRVGRFLHRRGFSSELIWRLLHEEQQG